MSSNETRAAHGDEGGEGLRTDEAVEDVEPSLFVELWDIHGIFS